MKPVCELIEKYKNCWKWCTLCRCPTVIYTCCGNTICNGGGCNKCDETYEETNEIIRNKLAPTIDQIVNAIEDQRKFDLHYTEDRTCNNFFE